MFAVSVYQKICNSYQAINGLFSSSPNKLKAIIGKLNETNTKINIGNKDSIDLVLKIINFIKEENFGRQDPDHFLFDPKNKVN